VEILRLDMAIQLVLSRLPLLFLDRGFIAHESWDDEAPATIAVRQLRQLDTF